MPQAIRRARALPLLLALAVAAALAVALSGAAGNGDGTPVTFGHAKGTVTQNADGSRDLDVTVTEPKTVDLTGKTQKVATGTTTKFRVIGGQGVWNAKIWWDDLGAGSSWKTTQTSNWNPGNHYGIIDIDIHYGDSTCHCGSQGPVLHAGETEFRYDDHTSGGPTTWFDPTEGVLVGQNDIIHPSGCLYLIPTGGSEVGSC